LGNPSQVTTKDERLEETTGEITVLTTEGMNFTYTARDHLANPLNCSTLHESRLECGKGIVHEQQMK